MNIDKKRMDMAWKYRNEDPKAMIELMDYFKQMAEYFARKFGISSYYRDDYISESLDQAQRALKNFNLGKSSTYSYFYKVMSNSFRYSLRRDGRKRDKMPSTCSYEELSNMASGQAFNNNYHIMDQNLMEDDNNQVLFMGKQYDKDDLIALIKEGKSLAKKANKLSDKEAREKFINKIEHELLRKCVLGIIEKKEIRENKKRMKDEAI